MTQDLETQPLLESREDNLQLSPEVSRSTYQRPQWYKSGKLLAITVSTLLLLTVITVSVKIFHQLPSQEVLQDSVLSISNWKLNKVEVDGWTDGDDYNNVGSKAIQLSTQIDFWPDYNSWLDDNSTALDEREKKRYRFISERLVRTACFRLNNLTTFDGQIDQDNIVGLLSIDQPFCIDLHDNHTTQLNLTMRFTPNMDNLLRVLKKIWHHDYDKLDLSSLLNVTLMSEASFMKRSWKLPLAELNGIRIFWKDIIDWDLLDSLSVNLRHLFKNLSVKDLSLKDSVNGFHLDIKTDPLLPEKFLNWITFPKNSVFPLVNWQLRLPDCSNEFSIDLPTVFCFTDEFEIEEKVRLSAYTDVEGPLPEALLSQVCWSDEENAMTPMTRLLNKVFNNTQLITMLVKGHIAKSQKEDSNSIIPYEFLDKAFEEISFFPVSANFTLDSASLIEDVTVEGLKIKWVTSFLGERRLTVAGKVVALMSLPFYETSKNRLLIKHIKGESFLYHEGKLFLILPMRYWTQASSRIYHDAETDNTMIQICFDIRDDELQVADSIELTKVLNKIFMSGKAEVEVESNLDILLSSPLGDMALMGLKGNGKAVVRS